MWAAVRVTRRPRSPYDHYMLHLHDMAKADAGYQTSSPRSEIAFGPSVWLVFTDQVPHAALGGRNALEQTFYLPVAAQLQAPEAYIRSAATFTISFSTSGTGCAAAISFGRMSSTRSTFSRLKVRPLRMNSSLRM